MPLYIKMHDAQSARKAIEMTSSAYATSKDESISSKMDCMPEWDSEFLPLELFFDDDNLTIIMDAYFDYGNKCVRLLDKDGHEHELSSRTFLKGKYTNQTVHMKAFWGLDGHFMNDSQKYSKTLLSFVDEKKGHHNFEVYMEKLFRLGKDTSYFNPTRKDSIMGPPLNLLTSRTSIRSDWRLEEPLAGVWCEMNDYECKRITTCSLGLLVFDARRLNRSRFLRYRYREKIYELDLNSARDDDVGTIFTQSVIEPECDTPNRCVVRLVQRVYRKKATASVDVHPKKAVEEQALNTTHDSKLNQMLVKVDRLKRKLTEIADEGKRIKKRNEQAIDAAIDELLEQEMKSLDAAASHHPSQVPIESMLEDLVSRKLVTMKQSNSSS